MYIYIYKGKVIFIKYLKIHPSLRISSPFFFFLVFKQNGTKRGKRKRRKGSKGRDDRFGGKICHDARSFVSAVGSGGESEEIYLGEFVEKEEGGVDLSAIAALLFSGH